MNLFVVVRFFVATGAVTLAGGVGVVVLRRLLVGAATHYDIILV